MGKTEGAGWSKEGQGYSEESFWSQADECRYAEEAISDDESEMGGEEEGSVARFRSLFGMATAYCRECHLPRIGTLSCKTVRLTDDMVWPHHLIVFVFKHVTVPHILKLVSR